MVRRHFPESTKTWKGHGKKIRSNLRSTLQLVESDNDGILYEELTVKRAKRQCIARRTTLKTKWKEKCTRTKRAGFQLDHIGVMRTLWSFSTMTTHFGQ